MSPRSFASVQVGDTLPETRKVLSREDIAAYAEASLDRNDLHLDDEAARARGFDGVIGHGMLTMAHLTTSLTDWAGDVGAILHVKTAFRAVVRPGDEMVAGGTVIALDPERRTAKLEVWVMVDRGGEREPAIRRGAATVRLA